MKKMLFIALALGLASCGKSNEKTHDMSSMNSDILMAMHHPMMMQKMVTGMHPDISFLENMMPHHQGAIDSSKLLLKKSKNAEVKQIAENIIKAQEKEIAEFTTLIATLKEENKDMGTVDVAKFDQEAQDIMANMMTAMSMESTDDIDRDFLSGMIPHHQGAVDASKQILMYTKDPRIIQIANTIIADQEKEIKDFQAILAR